jgi:hypothetical protein
MFALNHVVGVRARQMTSRAVVWGACVLAAVGAGCHDEAPVPSTVAPAAEPGIVFNDVTSRAGITFRYTFGDFAYDNILESSGSGVAFLDYNNDGDYAQAVRCFT